MMDIMHRLAKQTAWLCLLLLLFTTAAVTVHHHAGGNDSPTCELCLVASSAPVTAPSPSLQQTFAAVTWVHSKPVEAARQRLICFALSVRPPPEDHLA